MKTILTMQLRTVTVTFLICAAAACSAQTEKTFIEKYLTRLPSIQDDKHRELLKYRMTAIYTNRDLYGNFTSKTKITGDYTKGPDGDSVCWNNVFISGSQSFDAPFTKGTKQNYIENFKYIPSDKMLSEEAFKSFPSSPENVFARNLIWDMFALETFAWNYYDSLKLNKTFVVPDISGQFDMAAIGNYSHNKITLTWKGITQVSNSICAVIDFAATDNKVEINMAGIKTKGTEQYWGTILVSLTTKNIEHAEMYGGTIQEIEVTGMKDKFLVKTIRELEVVKIQ